VVNKFNYKTIFLNIGAQHIRYRDNRPGNKPNHKTDPQTGPITIHCAASYRAVYSVITGNANTANRL